MHLDCPPIRSLAYFRPVIDELRAHPAPESYLDYLRLKLRQAAAALPANVQKSTFSDDSPAPRRIGWAQERQAFP